MITPVVQSARFFAGPGGDTKYNAVIQPAVIDIDGLKLSSPVPKSAAEAASINSAIDKLIKSQLSK